MDLSCIISSGDLELYILGMLPEEEAYKIEQLAGLFPEIRAELDRISESLEGLGNAGTVVPSPAVKAGLMEQLKQLKEEEEAAAPSPLYKVEASANSEERLETPVIPVRSRSGNRSLLLAASLIGFVLSLGAAVYLNSRQQERNTELAAIRQRLDTLTQHFSAQQQQLQASNQMLQMLQSGQYKKVNLANPENTAEMMAQVFWNTATHEVYISDVALPQPPASKQYQLWAIVDGKPVDAGVIGDARQRVQKMKAFDKAEAFAISIEKEGGSPVPTQVYLVGKV